MKILGINDGHNASACLYIDGQIAAAIQEERLRRVKNWAGFPSHSVREVCRIANVAASDIDFVAMNGEYAARPMTRETLMEEYRTINDFRTSIWRNVRRQVRRAAKLTPIFGIRRQGQQRQRLQELAELGVPADRALFVEHHTAHASAAYYGWGRFSDDVLVLTCDGAGDGLCATVSIGRNGRLERLAEIPQSDSIANIYAMITYLMGMVPLEHEYKLMGLAPYADPEKAGQFFRELCSLMRFDAATPLTWERTERCPETYCSYAFFRDLLERRRFDAIAGGLQRFTEHMLTTWVANCVRQTGIRRVALSGGIFMNVKANKLIMELPEVDELFVYPSCGDETNAMGAAYAVYADRAGCASMQPLRDVYWGPEHSDAEIERAIRGFAFTSRVTFRHADPIEPVVAELLAQGTVVARFKGREEFGARAMGNRSLLADPRSVDAVRVLNEAIKSRDFWMPFAGSVLEECSDSLYQNEKNVPAPYMILSFDTTGRWRDILAAIHPFDHTMRPQEVSSEWNPSYHSLISAFARRTGVPAVLNTSFNLHGHPIVSRPEDALDVLDRSGLTHLALGNWLVEKQ
jgi:carbamoyltransferase